MISVAMEKRLDRAVMPRKKIQTPTEVLRGRTLDYIRFDSDLGPMLAAADEEGVVLLSFQAGEDPVTEGPSWRENQARLREVVDSLRAYFQGVDRLSDLPVGKLPGTEFQRKVWRAMREIPWGHTRTYGELARDIGHPAAMRAVGAACGANPLPLINPCHRVMGAAGALTGFSCGLEFKRRLLRLEGSLS